jgi:hypothetical protein
VKAMTDNMKLDTGSETSVVIHGYGTFINILMNTR